MLERLSHRKSSIPVYLMGNERMRLGRILFLNEPGRSAAPVIFDLFGKAVFADLFEQFFQLSEKVPTVVQSSHEHEAPAFRCLFSLLQTPESIQVGQGVAEFFLDQVQISRIRSSLSVFVHFGPRGL